MDWLLRKITDLSENDYKKIYEGLTDSRRAHIDRKKKEDDKKRSLLATALIEELLSRQNIDGKLDSDADGRPFFNNNGFYISISHSELYVAAALSSEKVGIDIEKIKPMKVSLINYVCCENEKNYVFNSESPQAEIITDKDTLIRFFEVWTTKEAYFKKHGEKNLISIDSTEKTKNSFIKDDYLITVL